MKEIFKKMVRERLAKVAKESFDENPMKGTPFEGMIIQNELVNASKSYKQKFIEERQLLGLSEEEVIEIIDDATNEIINKIFN